MGATFWPPQGGAATCHPAPAPALTHTLSAGSQIAAAEASPVSAIATLTPATGRTRAALGIKKLHRPRHHHVPQTIMIHFLEVTYRILHRDNKHDCTRITMYRVLFISSLIHMPAPGTPDEQALRYSQAAAPANGLAPFCPIEPCSPHRASTLKALQSICICTPRPLSPLL